MPRSAWMMSSWIMSFTFRFVTRLAPYNQPELPEPVEIMMPDDLILPMSTLSADI